MIRNFNKQDIIFRPAGLSDVPQLAGLMNLAYARQKSEKYFVWQFFESIYPTVLITACAGRRIIGMFGLQKRELNNGAVVGQAIDMLIEESWRGKGLFPVLASAAFESFYDLDVLCVFPNLTGKVAVEHSLGWKCIGKIDALFLNAKQYHPDHIKQFASPGKPFHDLTSLVYDSEIIKWRFEKHPEYKYRLITHENGIYAVTKVFVDSLTSHRVGDIVYLGIIGREYGILHKVMEKAVESFLEDGIDVISVWGLPHTPVYAYATAAGFQPIPQERFFCVKVLNSRFSYLDSFESWHLLQADVEIY